MIKEAFVAWVSSEGEVETREFQKNSSYVLVYRDTRGGGFALRWVRIIYQIGGVGRMRGSKASDASWRIFPGGPSSEAMLDFPFGRCRLTAGYAWTDRSKYRATQLAENLSVRYRDFKWRGAGFLTVV